MIGKGETDQSVILEKKLSGEINGCNRVKKESGRERKEQEEKAEEDLRNR
jgi:hypothetical protein